MIDHYDRVTGCLVGLACGDAVGTTTEFQKRDSVPPVTDMVGGGVFSLRPGEWTDDTSMALCLADSLLACKGFNGNDQMTRYHSWWKTGYNSSNGTCFDIGTTTVIALTKYRHNNTLQYYGDDNPRASGNGSLMRLAPVAIFYHKSSDMDLVHFAKESSRVTHASAECLDSCAYFSLLLKTAFVATDKQQLLDVKYNAYTDNVAKLIETNYIDLTRDQIKSTGYVIDSLHAALWCFYTTDTFELAILLATNLCDDSDTVAAICGQIAGAFYGHAQIPKSWISKLVDHDHIKNLAIELAGSIGIEPIM